MSRGQSVYVHRWWWDTPKPGGTAVTFEAGTAGRVLHAGYERRRETVEGVEVCVVDRGRPLTELV